MKPVRITILLALTLILGLGMASSSIAKNEPKAPPGPLQAYLLCLESPTEKPGAPKIRWNLMVAHPKPGPMANVSGQLIVAKATVRPPLYITLEIKGTYDTQSGQITFKGKGGGTDNAAYEIKGMVTLEKKTSKGPYVIDYRKAGTGKWTTVKGEAMTVPCVSTTATQ